MGEFNNWLKCVKAHLKSFSGADVKELHYHSLPTLKSHRYDAAAIHVGIIDLLNNDSRNDPENYVALDEICGNIVNLGLRCRSFNIPKIHFNV